ncbi:hematopoietic cell signal transducer [Antechinus flavipes]|uniref:hematopoietic cell signal transducer n=1 Tax=Antechinus flavipes TaxID=38775 RepID=UPI00223566DE|nr:hematopoietic cell signal transducer [Antechinus flavipes]
MNPCGASLLLALLTVAAAQMPSVPDSHCGPLSLPLLVGFVAADALVTLLIVGAVFVCARPRRAAQKSENSRVYVNMPGRN